MQEDVSCSQWLTQVLSDPQQRLARRLSRPPRAAQAKRARCPLQQASTREGVQKQKLAFGGIGQMCVAKVAMPHSMSTRQTHIGSGCKGICCCRTVVHRKSLCGKSEAPGKSGPLSRTPSLPSTHQATNLLPCAESPGQWSSIQRSGPGHTVGHSHLVATRQCNRTANARSKPMLMLP